MRSAGTKWGIPPDSSGGSGNSTPGPAPADSVTARVQGLAGEKQGGSSQTLETRKQPSRGGQLQKPAVEVGEGSSTAQQLSVQKKAPHKSKSVPVGTTKRGRGRPRGRGRGQPKVTTVDYDNYSVPFEVEPFDGISADDADAKMARIFRGFR
ncbi:hypothetical protein M405DRAFT_855455 [Rhizopogon salebrosus TDB-379]|nr:hypothetical protein M405DRAFT_855455 [Rhizopogon salebrosus TDB-379]